MKYRLRYDNTELYTIHERDVVGNVASPSKAIELVKPVKYDDITTIFTCVDNVFYQYSTARKNSRNINRMICFGGEDDNYKKYDDKSLYHSKDELLSVIGRLNSGESLRDLKLIDYENNDGKEIAVKYRCGETNSDEQVCAGYLIKQQLRKDTATPIFVPEKKWKEFLSTIKVYGVGYDVFINLLLER